MTSHSPRVVLALLPLALLAGLVAWLVLDESDATADDAAGVGRADPVEPAGGQAELAPASASRDLDAASAPARVEAAPAPSEATEASTDDGAETVKLLSGTIALLDDDGARVEALSGALGVAVRSETFATVEVVEVTDGRFELTVLLARDGAVRPTDGGGEYRGSLDEFRCTCQSFETDEHGAMLFCDPESGETLDDDPSFPARTDDAAVAVRPAPSLTLHVRDATSGVALTGVEIRGSFGISHGRHPRSGNGSLPVVDDADSPVTILPTTMIVGHSEVTLLVHADGYAWDVITVDMSTEGERTIELIPGGALDVTLEGEVPDSASLRLREGESGIPVVDIGLRGRSAERIESLPAGPYEASVELGPWYSNPIRVGEATAEVVAGSASAVTVTVETPEPARTADLSGLLVLPAAWGDERPSLELRRLTASKAGAKRYDTIRGAALEPIEGTPGHFRFAKPSLETGQYKLSYGSFDASVVFDLPPEGRTDLVLEIGPPVDITVRVVDADTGLDVTSVDRLTWRVPPAGDDVGGSLESVQRDPETGLFECRVPRGPIEVTVRGATHGELTIPQAIDGLEVSLEVRERPSATVVLRSGDEVVPWPSGKYSEAEQVDGDGRSNAWGTSEGERWFGVSEPGRYRLTIPEIDGFVPHEPVEVEITAGERARVVVELVRR